MNNLDVPGALTLRHPLLSRERVFQGGYLAVDRELYNSKLGQTVREVVRVRDGVCVLAVLPDGTVPLVRQFRQAIDTVILELPAGVLDAEETPLQAAQRELAEEAGVCGGTWTHLLHYAHAEGYSTGFMDLFLCQGGDPCELRPDHDEEIEVVHLTLAEFYKAVAEGRFLDAKSMLAAHTASHYLPLTNL